MTWAKQLFKDSPLSIAQGEVSGHHGEHKFGAVPSMSQGQSGTIWDVSDTSYPWTAWDTAGTVTIPAVNASDNGKTVTIVGLDADFEPQEETLTVSSAGTVTSTLSYARLYRAYMVTGVANVANINVQKGGTTVLRITAGKGQTLMAVYTVPARCTAYFKQVCSTCQANADATVDVYFRLADSGLLPFRIGHTFEVSGAGGQYMHQFGIPLALPEKTDIDLRATVRSNNARITASFDMILVRDGYEHV